MQFFKDMFTSLQEFSASMPQLGFKEFYILFFFVILLAGFVMLLLYLAIPTAILIRSISHISKILGKTDVINDDNISDFTQKSFARSGSKALKNAWTEYVGVRYGYPSDVITEKKVIRREVNKRFNIVPSIFLIVSLLYTAFFAFWGFGAIVGSSNTQVAVVIALGCILSAVIYMVLILMPFFLRKKCIKNFSIMLELLDSKTNFQIDNSYACDNSPLANMAFAIDQIIARNALTTTSLEKKAEQELSQMSNTADDAVDVEQDKVYSKTLIEEMIEVENALREHDADLIAQNTDISSDCENVADQIDADAMAQTETQSDLVTEQPEMENMSIDDIQPAESQFEESEHSDSDISSVVSENEIDTDCSQIDCSAEDVESIDGDNVSIDGVVEEITADSASDNSAVDQELDNEADDTQILVDENAEVEFDAQDAQNVEDSQNIDDVLNVDTTDNQETQGVYVDLTKMPKFSKQLNKERWTKKKIDTDTK